MYRSQMYVAEQADIDAFIAEQRHGYLIATPPGGHPRVTIVPFVKRGDLIEVHMVQEDDTFKTLQQNPRVTFFVSDFLAWSRHDWVDPSDAGRATLNFKAVQFDCEATTLTAPDAVAAALRGLLERYEPGAAYTPIADNDTYGGRLRRLAAVHMRVLRTEAKFKVGPAAPVETKRNVVRGLRQRAEPGDSRAADVIEATLPG